MVTSCAGGAAVATNRGSRTPLEVLVDALAGMNTINVGTARLLVVDCDGGSFDHVHFWCMQCWDEVRRPDGSSVPIESMSELLYALEHHRHVVGTEPHPKMVQALQAHQAGKGGALH